MSQPVYDALIVGGGIVGAACAAKLAGEGLGVAIVEQDLIGGGATAAGMGHLVVMDDSEAQFALTRNSQQLWMNLRPELPTNVEYQQCGTLWIAADDEEMAEVHRKYRFYSERDVPVEIIDAKGLKELEPNLRSGLAGALLVPEDAVIYPPCAAKFLASKSQTVLHATVRRFEHKAVLLADGSRISAGVIVNATGTWAPELIPGLDSTLR